MAYSVPPHRWQATRLPSPSDSPGKNTGVGCHFLLQCTKVKSESEVAQSCPTLSDPKDCSLPGFSIHGSFQARVLEWGAFAFSKIYIYIYLNVNHSISLILCPFFNHIICLFFAIELCEFFIYFRYKSLIRFIKIFSFSVSYLFTF